MEDETSSSIHMMIMIDYKEMLEKGMKNLPEKTDNTDRFEIPKAEVEHSGKLTIIKNFSDIAKTLRRDEKHIAKFLFKELAVPGSITNGELRLQGKVGDRMVNQRILEYAEKYVLCKSCGKSDTNIHKDGKYYFLKCEACGTKRSLGK